MGLYLFSRSSVEPSKSFGWSSSVAETPRSAADKLIDSSRPRGNSVEELLGGSGGAYPRDVTSPGPDQVLSVAPSSVSGTGRGSANGPRRMQFVPGNPNPSRYKILKEETVGSFLIVDIKYEDCKNYEGRKILVFKDATFIDLVNQKLIDPHFCENDNFISPIARFEPTERGWSWAKAFAQSQS